MLSFLLMTKCDSGFNSIDLLSKLSLLCQTVSRLACKLNHCSSFRKMVFNQLNML